LLIATAFHKDIAVLAQNVSGAGTPKREFTVADEHHYNRSGPLRWILSHLARYPGLVVSFAICAALTNLLFSALPRLTGVAFDEVTSPQPDPWRLTMIALVALGVVLVRGVIDLTNSWSIETLGQRLERDARDELYISLLGKSQTFHNRQRVGDIMARATNDIRQLNPMMNPGVALIIESVMAIVAPLIFMALIDPQLVIIPLVWVVFYIVLVRRYMRQLNPVAGAQRYQFGVMNAGLNETITGIEVVKAAAQESQEKRKFYENASRFRDYFVKEGQVQARYLPTLFLAIALALAFAQGLWLYVNGVLSLGDLVAFMGLMGVLRFPAFISIFTFQLVQMGMAGARRILDLMAADSELDENSTGHRSAMIGHVAFEDVTFQLPDSALATLHNIHFTVKPGQTVAIVGQTGSGKTTLTKLINRIYDVNQGRILIDGVDVRNWNLASLRSQISIIEQDIFLFSRTIAENIAFGVGQNANREQVIAAAQAAQAHDFIMSFRDGYDTEVGERGVTLSGGQRQRIAIARALLTNPSILILDDSTSAIDSRTEDEIQRAIDRVLEGRTTFLITHRLSQIRRADVIVVLHQGSIVDMGSHTELLARCALYQRIFARYD
jgi:ATP-binding cassette subfamily B protein